MPVAAALAGGLREQHRAAGALLVAWPSPAPPRAALGDAGGLAAGGTAAGPRARAVARGRLAWLALAPASSPRRAALAAVDVPAVIAVPARGHGDRYLLAERTSSSWSSPRREPGLEALALAGLEVRPAPVVVHRPLDSPGPGPAAMAGWATCGWRYRGDDVQPAHLGAGTISRRISGAQHRRPPPAFVATTVARRRSRVTRGERAGVDPARRRAASRSSSARWCSGRRARRRAARRAAQRAADLAALAGARAMHDAYARLFEPALLDGRAEPAPPGEGATTSRSGARRRVRVARANGASRARVPFPDADSFAPSAIRVDACATARGRPASAASRRSRERGGGARAAAAGSRLRQRRRLRRPARVPPGQADAPRRRARLRPDGARGARRRRRAARSPAAFAPTPSRPCCSPATPTRAGSRRPARRCTASAPSSTSARRRPTAGWRPTRRRFHFMQRYGWEPWHYGYTLNARSSPGAARRRRRRRRGTLPDFVPGAFAPAIARAAQRWNVSATLLAAQLYAESELQPVRGRAARARRGSRSSCPAPPPRSASATRSTPSARSTPRRT